MVDLPTVSVSKTGDSTLTTRRAAASAEPSVLMTQVGAIAVVTLNRPSARNAMTPEMSCRLAEIFGALRADGSVKCIVLTGAGDKAFSSGGDLALTLPLLTGARSPETEWDHRLLSDPSVLKRAGLQDDDFGTPIVAAVNGACLAGGFEMLLGTDIRVAAENAIFGLPEVVHGLVPFAGAPTRLPQQIAFCHAQEMMLTGAPVDAQTAFRFGLVNEVLPAALVLDRAIEIAERIASNGAFAVQSLKRTVLKAAGQPTTTGYLLEDENRQRVLASPDAKEGPRAFMEKRRPRFSV